MKPHKFLLIARCLLVLSLSYMQVNAQECIATDSVLSEACCNGFIKTDSMLASNPARPGLRNRFDWSNPKWKVYIPTNGGGYTFLGTQPKPMDNPFFTQNAQLKHLNFATYNPPLNPDSLDFHPRDGWELLHKYDGYDSLGVNYLFGGQSLNRPGPYVMLYNRYTGRLRILASFEGIIAGTDLMETKLQFRTPLNPANKPTTLFMKNSNIAQPLSQKTSIAVVSTVSNATSTNEFFASEFDLAYDPCICLNYSQIEVNFGVIDIAQINLSGRLIGTSQVLNSNGTSPLLNDEDFLTSVYKNGLDVEAGSIIYKNVDDLIAKYKSPPGLTQFEQIALGVVGSIVKAGLGGADKWLTSVIDGAVTQSIKDIGLIDGANLTDSEKNEFKVKTGLKLIGDQSDRILTAMGLKSSTTRPPNPSVIEAEMALTGTISNGGPIGGNSSIILRTPGSLGTDDTETTSPWFNYPTYNEPLGTFALLDSPLVKRTTAMQRDPYPYEPGYENPPGSLINYNSWLSSHARYRFEDIEYVFNPASEVDAEKTVILGALVVKGTPATRVEEFYDPFLDISTYTYSESVPNIDLVAGMSDYYVSPFLSLECLKDYIVGDFLPGSQVYLRLMIQYVFKENAYGKVNQAFEVLTYPVKFASTTLPPYTYLPDTLIVDGATAFTQNTTLKARNVIVVTGGLTLNAGVTVTLAAGREVLVIPNVTLPPGISIELGAEAILGCDYPVFSQEPMEVVKTFCNSTRYKANQLSNRVASPQNDPIDNIKEKQALTAYPNPFTHELTLEFTLPAAGVTSARLLDPLGREVMMLWNGREREAGPQSETIDLSALAAGIYLAVLETPQGRQTVRVVKE